MVVNIKNEMFKLKMGIEDQKMLENKKLTEDKKARIKALRTEIKRIMDTMLVQDISLKVHTKITKVDESSIRMDERMVFGLETLCEFIELNQYDSIIKKVKEVVS